MRYFKRARHRPDTKATSILVWLFSRVACRAPNHSAHAGKAPLP